MSSAPKAAQLQVSSSKLLKNPKFSAATSSNSMARPDHPDSTHNPNSALMPSTSAPPISMCQEDRFLARSSHLSRSELLRRRSYYLKRLSKCYRDHYWALMEDLKAQYREYYWRYGVSPFKKENEARNGTGQALDCENGENGDIKLEGSGENGTNNCGNANKGYLKSNQCSYLGCKLKAMALTSFCHLHILRDPNQRLYKECNYVIKNAQGGPIYCSKPILRSTIPSLCVSHFQRAHKHVTRALKKAGLNVSSSSKLAPKFHVLVAEYVRQIQTKRRAALKKEDIKNLIKQEDSEHMQT